MTPEQLQNGISELCRIHKLSSVRIALNDPYGSGFTWAVWRGTQFEWGNSFPECLRKLLVIPDEQQQWNEERMRAGA